MKFITKDDIIWLLEYIAFIALIFALFYMVYLKSLNSGPGCHIDMVIFFIVCIATILIGGKLAVQTTIILAFPEENCCEIDKDEQ